MRDYNFDDKIRDHHYILVEFMNGWCSNCKKFYPKLEQITLDFMVHYPMISVGQVEMGYCEELRERFDIRHNPTLILFKEGQQIGRYRGREEVADVEEWAYSFIEAVSDSGQEVNDLF